MELKEVQYRLNKVFSNLIFDRQRHLYFVKGVNYPSVSSRVEHYVEPFDEAYWLPICARNEKKTEHDLKREWQLKNTTACELGSDTHDFLENYTGYEIPRTPQEIAGIKFLKSLGTQYVILRRELRGYTTKFGYAGTMDLPLYNRETGKIVVADYKTNGDLFKSFRTLKDPFGYLENTPYNHYQIQLSLYQIILEEIGLEVEDRWLVYLKADEQYKIYPLYNYTDVLREDLKIAA